MSNLCVAAIISMVAAIISMVAAKIYALFLTSNVKAWYVKPKPTLVSRTAQFMVIHLKLHNELVEVVSDYDID